MAYNKATIVLSSILLSFAFTQTEALECYNCYSTPEFDGIACDDPLDTSAIGTVQCSSSNSVGKTLSAFVQGKLQDDDDYVCFTVTMNENGRTATERKCAPKELGGEEVCAYLIDKISDSFNDFKCNTCDSSLCNN